MVLIGIGKPLLSSNIILIVRERKAEAISLFLGLELGAMSHSISDLLGSAIKKKQKRKTSQQKQLQKAKK